MKLFLKLCWWCVAADYKVTLMHSQTHCTDSLFAALAEAARLTAFPVRFLGSDSPDPAGPYRAARHERR